MNKLFRTLKGTTICAKCESHIREGTDIWYDQKCAAHKRQECVNVVTGKNEYLASNDLGQEYTTTEPHPYCRDINTGSCAQFKSKIKEIT